MKFFELPDDKNNIFEMIIADLHVIKFRQNGLSHAQMPFILQSEKKIHNFSGFDSIMCTEIPDKDTKPELFLIIQCSIVQGL